MCGGAAEGAGLGTRRLVLSEDWKWWLHQADPVPVPAVVQSTAGVAIAPESEVRGVVAHTGTGPQWLTEGAPVLLGGGAGLSITALDRTRGRLVLELVESIDAYHLVSLRAPRHFAGIARAPFVMSSSDGAYGLEAPRYGGARRLAVSVHLPSGQGGQAFNVYSGGSSLLAQLVMTDAEGAASGVFADLVSDRVSLELARDGLGHSITREGVSFSMRWQ